MQSEWRKFAEQNRVLKRADQNTVKSKQDHCKRDRPGSAADERPDATQSGASKRPRRRSRPTSSSVVARQDDAAGADGSPRSVLTVTPFARPRGSSTKSRPNTSLTSRAGSGISYCFGLGRYGDCHCFGDVVPSPEEWREAVPDDSMDQSELASFVEGLDRSSIRRDTFGRRGSLRDAGFGRALPWETGVEILGDIQLIFEVDEQISDDEQRGRRKEQVQMQDAAPERGLERCRQQDHKCRSHHRQQQQQQQQQQVSPRPEQEAQKLEPAERESVRQKREERKKIEDEARLQQRPHPGHATSFKFVRKDKYGKPTTSVVLCDSDSADDDVNVLSSEEGTAGASDGCSTTSDGIHKSDDAKSDDAKSDHGSSDGDREAHRAADSARPIVIPAWQAAVTPNFSARLRKSSPQPLEPLDPGTRPANPSGLAASLPSTMASGVSVPKQEC